MSHTQRLDGMKRGLHVFQDERDTRKIYAPESWTDKQGSVTMDTHEWPSARWLADWVWEHRSSLANQHILELGAGTGLVGLTAAACGAKVTLTDQKDRDLKQAVLHNQLDARVGILKWGKYPPSFWKPWKRVTDKEWKDTWKIWTATDIWDQFDLVLGADILFDPWLYEDVVAILDVCITRNSKAHMVTAVHERGDDWASILKQWNMQWKVIGGDDVVHIVDIWR